jgi:hypothetical protein
MNDVNPGLAKALEKIMIKKENQIPTLTRGRAK